MSLLRPGSVQPGERPATSLVDKILEGGMNLCCLREENLFTAEHEAGHRWVRRCRVCGSRHIRMKAEATSLGAMFSGANTIQRRPDGTRRIRMGADAGGLGARLPGAG